MQLPKKFNKDGAAMVTGASEQLLAQAISVPVDVSSCQLDGQLGMGMGMGWERL